MTESNGIPYLQLNICLVNEQSSITESVIVWPQIPSCQKTPEINSFDPLTFLQKVNIQRSVSKGREKEQQYDEWFLLVPPCDFFLLIMISFDLMLPLFSEWPLVPQECGKWPMAGVVKTYNGKMLVRWRQRRAVRIEEKVHLSFPWAETTRQTKLSPNISGT